LTPPQPDHPFESANQFTRLHSADDDASDDQFTRLHSADDDASDDGSRRSADLLTPGDLAPREDVAFSQGSAFSPGFDGVLPTPPAGDILAPPVAADKGSLSTLEDLVRANAAGIAELWEMMRANAANITVYPIP
jgi:hypothetical protein